MKRLFWLIVAWLTWPLYRLGWKTPYAIVSGRYARAAMAEAMRKSATATPAQEDEDVPV